MSYARPDGDYPLLEGRYTITKTQTIWEGEWGMTESDDRKFPFKYIATTPTTKREILMDSEIQHPVFLSMDFPSSNNNNIKIDPGSIPTQATYTGGFYMQNDGNSNSKQKQKKIQDLNMQICFYQSGSIYKMYGIGKNMFGWFTMEGVYNPEKSSMWAAKMYTDDDEIPKLPQPGVKTARKVDNLSAISITESLPNDSNQFLAKRNAKSKNLKEDDGHLLTPSSKNTLSSKIDHNVLLDSFLNNNNDQAAKEIALEKCTTVLNQLMKHSFSFYFNEAVDPIALGIPDYFNVIKNPMDFSLILDNLEGKKYKNENDFCKDINLVFSNCILYNAKGTEAVLAAKTVEKEFKTLYARIFNGANYKTPNISSKKKKQINADNGDNYSVTLSSYSDDGASTGKGKGVIKSKGLKSQKEIELVKNKSKPREVKAVISTFKHSEALASKREIDEMRKGLDAEFAVDLPSTKSIDNNKIEALKIKIKSLPILNQQSALQIMNERSRNIISNFDIDFSTLNVKTIKDLFTFVESYHSVLKTSNNNNKKRPFEDQDINKEDSNPNPSKKSRLDEENE